ncbi:MAG: hypothetical protein Q8J78_12845 [Moraxellaceae bacterium]|nr:hypothetical protein [Moraxellaceae bacterium]
MKLLIVMVVLLLRQQGHLAEPAAAIGHLVRRWRDGWLQRGQREGWAAPLVLMLIVLLPALVLALLMGVVSGLWQHLLEAALGLVVLALILFDRTLPDVMARAKNRLATTETAVVAGVILDAELMRVRRELAEEQFRELFAPLFWFLLLGPVAALVYYLLRLMVSADELPSDSPAPRCLHWMEWPAARVLALGFALAGDFTATWQHWRRVVFEREAPALDLLEDAATAAQPVRLEAGAGRDELLLALESVSALFRRTLVLWVVLLALHTLFGF